MLYQLKKKNTNINIDQLNNINEFNLNKVFFKKKKFQNLIF